MAAVPNNEKPDVCSKCKSPCCKKIPGAWAPSDLSVDEMVSLVRMKQAVFWYIGWRNVPVLRPRHFPLKKYESPVITHWNHGTCCYYSTKGCTLSFTERPLECRGLIPGDDHCDSIRWTEIDVITTKWARSKKARKAFSILELDWPQNNDY